jgi:hypothetical protein
MLAGSLLLDFEYEASVPVRGLGGYAYAWKALA